MISEIVKENVVERLMFHFLHFSVNSSLLKNDLHQLYKVYLTTTALCKTNSRHSVMIIRKACISQL